MIQVKYVTMVISLAAMAVVKIAPRKFAAMVFSIPMNSVMMGIIPMAMAVALTVPKNAAAMASPTLVRNVMTGIGYAKMDDLILVKSKLAISV